MTALDTALLGWLGRKTPTQIQTLYALRAIFSLRVFTPGKGYSYDIYKG